MKIEQTSDDDVLEELVIEGADDELRDFALGLLNAIDIGETEFEVGGTRVVLRCR